MYCAVSGCVQLYECICVFMHDGLSRVFASKSKLARSPKEIEKIDVVAVVVVGCWLMKKS